jgi:uncharacterized protein (TIRG00374 family)
MSSSEKRPFLNLARAVNLLIAVAIAGFVLATVDLRGAWEALQGADLWLVAIVVLLNLPFALLFTARSHLILTRLGYAVPLPLLLPISVLGNVAGMFTPAASGEYLRVTALKRAANVATDHGIALVLYERSVSIYLFLLTAVACLGIAYLPIAAAATLGALCLALCALPWATATFLLPHLPAASALAGESVLAAIARYVLKMAEQMRVLLVNAGLFLRWALLTVAIFGLMALQLKLLASSVAESISLPEAWIAMAATGLAIIASLLPFGAGIGDGSLTAVLTRMGVEFEHAAAIVLLLRATTTIPLLAMAGASYFQLNRRTDVIDATAAPGS